MALGLLSSAGGSLRRKQMPIGPPTSGLEASQAPSHVQSPTHKVHWCSLVVVSCQVGVLTRHILDDGRGFARSKVFKHGHEEATGRTSSIGQHNLCVSTLPLAPYPPHPDVTS